jgi:hypothetical protein
LGPIFTLTSPKSAGDSSSWNWYFLI